MYYCYVSEDKDLAAWNTRIPNLIAITIACVAGMPIVILLFCHLVPDLSGPIGDTIGGVSAPFIGLLSAILIFISFRAQIQANKTQLKANEDAREEANFKYLIEELDKFKVSIDNYRSSFPGDRFRSGESLSFFADSVPTYFYGGVNFGSDCESNLNHTKYLLISIENMISEQKKLRISVVFREILETKLWLYYLENLQIPLAKITTWNLNISKGKKSEKEKIRKTKTYQLSFEIYTKTVNLNSLFDSMKKEI